MKTEDLSKLLVFGSIQDKKEIISRLQHLGVMHISKADPSNQLVQDSPMQGVDVMSHLLLNLQYIAKQTNLDTSFTLEGLPPVEKVIEQANEFVEKHLGKVEDLSNEKKSLLRKHARILAQRSEIEKLPFALNHRVPSAHQRIVLLSENSVAGYPFPVKLKIQQEMKNQGQFFTEVFVLNKDLNQLHNSLRKSQSKQINLPEMPLGSVQFLHTLQREEKDINEKLDEIEKDFFRKINGKQSKIKFLITSLENYREQANITQKFLQSKNFFAVQGYVVKKDVQRIKNSFPETTIISMPADTKAPSKLKNKGFAKFFEPITTMFGIPTYSLIDPTPLVSLFFPFFFGFMLSDVGYGLLLLISIFAIYFQVGEKFKTPLIIFGTSAVSSIIFGMVFGSFFGNLVPITPLYQDSFSASFIILQVSLLIGLVHINLGVLLQIYQQFLKKTPLAKALQVTLPIPLIEGAVVLLLFKQYLAAIIVAIILLILLYREKGFFGIMDITGFFGTWFSYARLLALSLATAGVALAVNIVAQKALSLGKIGFVLWLFVIAFGHLFNFVLNIIGCTIHSVRLHYVEFFSLFYEGEGHPFKEFKIQRKMNGSED
ncbi:hypothetical protein HOA92_06985 [archaeon]|jgi:V/A-type H+/Na+-transporting ATPase subunit I|nr:hypothetical protein [archaeon]MBT6762757.1 hypothetical protein [archaeon]